MVVQRVVDRARHLAGQHHVEAEIADVPGDQLARVRHQHGAETIERDADRIGADDAGGAAIAEQQERQHLLEVGGFLQMQRTQLDVEDEHARMRLRAHDVARQLERVDGGIAAHEADHGALDRARQLAALDHLVIEAGRREAGATGDQHMADAVALGAELQAFDRGLRQLGRVPLEAAHARGDIGEIAAQIEALAVDGLAFRPVARRQTGIAVLDAGFIRHALEQQAVAAVAVEQRLRKAAEGVVHVVRRHGRGDAVDVGGGQAISPGTVSL